MVLVLDHDAEGSLGVILNRPTPVAVGDVLAGWEQLTAEPGVVFQGGPVSLESALGIAVIPGGSGGAPREVAAIDEPTPRRRPWGDAAAGLRRRADRNDPVGWRRVHGAIGLVDLETPPELLAAALGSLRIFAGYAGWGPGQLAAEVTAGAWYVVDSEPGDVSSPEPDGLWRSVLRRQRSGLAMVATYPDDPSLN